MEFQSEQQWRKSFVYIAFLWRRFGEADSAIADAQLAAVRYHLFLPKVPSFIKVSVFTLVYTRTYRRASEAASKHAPSNIHNDLHV